MDSDKITELSEGIFTLIYDQLSGEEMSVVDAARIALAAHELVEKKLLELEGA